MLFEVTLVLGTLTNSSFSFSFFLFLASFLIGSHLETLLLTIKSMTTSKILLCSANKLDKSSDSQSGNISNKLVNSVEELLLLDDDDELLLNLFR